MDFDLLRFLDYLATLNDVYIVGISQAMDWMKTPVPAGNVDTFPPWQENVNRPRGCMFPRNCRYDNGTWER